MDGKRQFERERESVEWSEKMQTAVDSFDSTMSRDLKSRSQTQTKAHVDTGTNVGVAQNEKWARQTVMWEASQPHGNCFCTNLSTLDLMEDNLNEASLKLI